MNDPRPAPDIDRARLRESIARHVMGWKIVGVAWASGADIPVWHDGDATPVMPSEAWRPDEDDAHCLRVVERMLALGFECRIVAREREWQASFARPAEARGSAEGDDWRLVLLEAALDAL